MIHSLVDQIGPVASIAGFAGFWAIKAVLSVLLFRSWKRRRLRAKATVT